MKTKKYITVLLILFALGVTHLFAETTYTFEYGSPSKTKTFTLTARNMHRTFITNDMPTNNYVAGFVIQNINNKSNITCKIWKQISGTFCWTDANDEEKEKLLNLRDVSYTNKIELNSTDAECLLEKFYYVETAYNVDVVKVSGGKEDFYIYDEYNCNTETGTFVFAKKENSKYSIMSFESKDNCQYAERKGNVTVSGFSKWLQSSKSFPLTGNDKYYEIILSLLYDSINNDPYKCLYINPNKYMTEYLNIAKTANVNILSTEEYYSSNKNYLPNSYKVLDKNDYEKIASEAERYLTKAVEYKMIVNSKEIIKNNRIYDGSKIINNRLEDSFEDNYQINGNPMPYLKNGFDTPELFWKKMAYQAVELNINTTLPENREYLTSKFRPGINSKKGAGCDNYGMLTGVLDAAGLKNKIEYYKNNKSICPVLNFNKYKFLSLNLTDSPTILDNKKDEMIIKNVDLNKITLIVPPGDFNRGDIIENENKDIGIIINNTNDFNKIKFIWIDKNVGFAKESLIDESFTKNKTKVIIRRIMQYSNVRQEYSIPVWDILDIEPDMNNVTASISKMREETQKSSEKYRWIPNTGEYLMLGGIHMTVRNKAGIILQGNKYRVSFLGAIDRNFVNTENGSSDNGNINTNKAERFLIKFFSGKNEIEQGKIYKEKINNQYSGNYRYVMDYSSNNMIPSYFTIGKGGLLYANKNPLIIGIRPESSEKAYPGDDLLLNFSTVATLESNVVSKGIIVNEQDYVAVYDKKMLWRANLYIDLKEPELNDLDWNNAHPWNAPADTTVAINKTPEWWDAVTENGSTLSANQRWGFNEWNRNLTVNDYHDEIFASINELPQGDGGQVTDFVSFTPIRTINGTMKEPESKNIIYNTVAYSYPLHAKESGTGDSGSMDSPFDFNKKMLIQQLQLNKWYKDNETRMNVPNKKFNENNYKELHAPSNSWYHYEVSTDSGISANAFIPSLGLRIGFSSYSQEVFIKGEIGNLVEKKESFFGTGQGKEGVYEAGTDCIGFAQRSASYKNNNYCWIDINDGWTESNKEDFKETLIDSGNRKYPYVNENGYTNTIAYNVVHTWDNANYDKDLFLNLTKNELTKKYLNGDDIRKKISRIVPGDIFVKDNQDDKKRDGSGETDDYFNDHIAIVAYVPYNIETMEIDDILSSIVLIEGEFGWRIQSVIKELSLKDYQNKYYKAGRLERMYKNFTNYEGEGNKYESTQSIELKCKAFAIRRLKCQ